MRALRSSDPAAALRALIAARPLEAKRVAEHLDALPHAERVAAIRALGRAEQRALYAAVDGFRPLHLTDLVSARVADGVTVRHHGKNTLPAFTHFEKRFLRPPGRDPEAPGELYGFNYQPTPWLGRITGPGYFLASEAEGRPEVRIDYNRVPDRAPEGWPAVRPNERGLSRLVYGFMVDTLRGVSEHVSIGSAARKGKDLGSWFILCRED